MKGDDYRIEEWPHRPGIIRPVRVDPSGRRGPTPGDARGPTWTTVYRGFHVPAWATQPTPEQRIINAAVLLPPITGITGWAALRWSGGYWFDGRNHREHRPVPIALGAARVRRRPGLLVCEERLNPRELAVIDSVSCTTQARSVCFEMRYAASVRAAVVMFDMAAYNDLVSISEISDYVMDHPGWTGIPQARKALTLVDENSWSPQETRMRLLWQIDGGLPRPLTNVPVFDLNGRHLFTPDLFDPVAGVCGEYDGAVHLDPRQRRRDTTRLSSMTEFGLQTVTMMGGDAPGVIVHRLRSAYSRAANQPASQRKWTIQPPVGWLPTQTVAERRTLKAQRGEQAIPHRRRPTYPASA